MMTLFMQARVIIFSNLGDDDIYAGQGADTIIGGTGADIIRGGGGPNDIDVGNDSSRIRFMSLLMCKSMEGRMMVLMLMC